jgi:RNase adapter protein RapZ
MTEPSNDARILLVTGVSGAGKSSALKALEDLGFEAIDNVPISLLGRLVSPGEFPDNTAIGVDIRTRDFDAGAFLAKVDALTEKGGIEVTVLFIDCDDDVLIRRYEETRRRHPLAQDRPVSDGIRHERALMEPLRERATVLLDTSDMVLGDLKRSLDGHFGTASSDGLSVFVTSFGFRNGLPRDADLVFDVRFLKNPHYDLALRSLTGRDKAVGDYIETDEGFQAFMDKLEGLLELLLERYTAEGKSYLTIALGCTGGHHRSVYTAETLGKWLGQRNQTVKIRHRDLDKR